MKDARELVLGRALVEVRYVLPGRNAPVSLYGDKERRLSASPLGASEAACVAKRVLERRIEAIHASGVAGDPLRVQFWTRATPPRESGVALCINWSPRFTGRTANLSTWNKHLLPALLDIVDVVRSRAPRRDLHVEGLTSLSAAIAFGRAFGQRCGVRMSWKQNDQMWSLDASREDSGFTIDERSVNGSSEDLFVFVAVNANPEHAVARSSGLPKPRAVVSVGRPGGTNHIIETPGQALDIAHLVVEAARRAKERYSNIRSIHVFAAVPAGLAMLLGQLQNTLGPVQTYEHLQNDTVGTYRKAALLTDT